MYYLGERNGGLPKVNAKLHTCEEVKAEDAVNLCEYSMLQKIEHVNSVCIMA